MRSSAATDTTILHPKYLCLGSSGANSSSICCGAQPFHAEAGKQAVHTFYEQRHRRRQQQQPMPSFSSQLWQIDDESHTSALSWLPQGCFSWHSTAFWPLPGHFSAYFAKRRLKCRAFERDFSTDIACEHCFAAIFEARLPVESCRPHA